jgi:hypothetical protein
MVGARFSVIFTAFMSTQCVISLLGRRCSTTSSGSAMVRALTTSSSTAAVRLAGTHRTNIDASRNTKSLGRAGIAFNGAARGPAARFALSSTIPQRFLSSTVEDDLDAALDNILGHDSLHVNGKETPKKNGARVAKTAVRQIEAVYI